MYSDHDPIDLIAGMSIWLICLESYVVKKLIIHFDVVGAYLLMTIGYVYDAMEAHLSYNRGGIL